MREPDRHWRRLADINTVANFAGRLGSALLMFLAIPVLVSRVGTESWGLVGFAVSITALATMLDLGLGAALTRDLSRYRMDASLADRQADLIKTYELPLLAIAVVATLLTFGAADVIAREWLVSTRLEVSTVVYCLRLTGVHLAFHLLAGFYLGGLVGLQRQLVCNGARLAFTAGLYGGAILLLSDTPAPGIERYFEWQLFCSAAYVGSLRFALFRHVRTSRHARWSTLIFREGMRFGLGIAGTALLVVCLTQLDKLLLSRLLSLSEFGAYTLAVTLTSLQVWLVQPVHTAVFPQLSALLSSKEEALVAEVFLRWTRRVSVATLPLGAAMCLFPVEITQLWLHDAELAEKIAIPVALLSLGSTMNALCTLPYTLQLAAGWSSLGFYSNLFAVVLMVPAILILAPRFGMAGAAAVWAALNFGYLAIQVPVMFRRLLVRYRRQWFLEAVLYPSGIALLVLGTARGIAVANDLERIGALLCCMAGAGVAGLLLALLVYRIETSSA